MRTALGTEKRCPVARRRCRRDDHSSFDFSNQNVILKPLLLLPSALALISYLPSSNLLFSISHLPTAVYSSSSVRMNLFSLIAMLLQYVIERLEATPISALHSSHDINQLTHLLPIVAFIETIRYDPGRPLCVSLVPDSHRIEQSGELWRDADPRDDHNPGHLFLLLFRSRPAAEAPFVHLQFRLKGTLSVLDRLGPCDPQAGADTELQAVSAWADLAIALQVKQLVVHDDDKLILLHRVEPRHIPTCEFGKCLSAAAHERLIHIALSLHYGLDHSRAVQNNAGDSLFQESVCPFLEHSLMSSWVSSFFSGHSMYR